MRVREVVCVVAVALLAALCGCEQEEQAAETPPESGSAPAVPQPESVGPQSLTVSLGQDEKVMQFQTAWLQQRADNKATLHFYTFVPPATDFFPELPEGQYHIEIDLAKADGSPISPGEYRRGDRVDYMGPAITWRQPDAEKPVSFLFAGENVGTVTLDEVDLKPDGLTRGKIDLQDPFGMALKGEFTTVTIPESSEAGADAEETPE